MNAKILLPLALAALALPLLPAAQADVVLQACENPSHCHGSPLVETKLVDCTVTIDMYLLRHPDWPRHDPTCTLP